MVDAHSAPILTGFSGQMAVLSWSVRQGLVHEPIVKTIIKAIAWPPPAIARLHLPMVALGSGGPRPIGPGEVVDGDAHAIALGRLGWENLLGWHRLLGCRRAHPWPSQGAAGQKTQGLSTHHRCIVDQLASLTHKAIVRCRMLAALPALGCLVS